MSDTRPGEERRQKRSEETMTAITYQLDYVREETGMDLFLVADADGLNVACSGDRDQGDLLAAYASQLAQPYPPEDALNVLESAIPGLTKNRLMVQSFQVDGIPMYLCAVSNFDATTKAGFERAMNGIDRIYRTTSLTAGNA